MFFGGAIYFSLRQFLQDTDEMKKKRVLNGILMATMFIDGMSRLIFPFIFLNANTLSLFRRTDMNSAIAYMNVTRMYILVVIGGVLAFLELLMPFIYLLIVRMS